MEDFDKTCFFFLGISLFVLAGVCFTWGFGLPWVGGYLLIMGAVIVHRVLNALKRENAQLDVEVEQLKKKHSEMMMEIKKELYLLRNKDKH